MTRTSSGALAAFVALAGGAGCATDDAKRPDRQPFWCVDFSPDGKSLAAGRGTYGGPSSGEGHGHVAVWPTDTWGEPRLLRNDLTSDVMGVAFTADGAEILAAGDAYLRNVPGTGNPWDGKRIYSWALETGKPNEPIVLRDRRDDEFLRGAGFTTRMAYSPEAGLVGLALSGDRPVVVDLKTRKPRYVPEGHEAGCPDLAFSPDGKALAACAARGGGPAGQHRSVRLYAADTGKLVTDSSAGGVEAVRLAYSPDGGQLAVGGKGGEVVFLAADLKKAGEPIRVAADPVTALAYSPRGDHVAVATDGVGSAASSAVRLVDVKQGKVVRALGEKLAWVHDLAFSPDGKLLAAAYGTRISAQRDEPVGGVKVWDTATGKLVADLK